MRAGGRVVCALFLVVAGSILPPAAFAQTAAGSSIGQEQVQVVSLRHRDAIASAQGAVNAFTQSVADARASLARDQAAAAAAASAEVAATWRLSNDQAALIAAQARHARADSALAADRSRLGAIALAVYTGQLSDPEWAGSLNFAAQQQQILDYAQVGVVAQQIDGRIVGDLAEDRRAGALEEADQAAVTGDQRALMLAQTQAAAAAASTRSDQSAMTTAQARLAQAVQTLGAAEQALTADVNALAGPASTPPGQLSILGGSALTPAQMAAWFLSQGYVDLTAAPIEQLATWYVQDGQLEGVRGDVAFAQAVLETGGFSSPDAVDLSNFAGIGHCDTCSAGWAFPSPAQGVLGHIQLLRIFATAEAGPSQPPPVRPELTVANQYERGCCATVDSLTGVWATDPTYGSQITQIYSAMLGFALSSTG